MSDLRSWDVTPPMKCGEVFSVTPGMSQEAAGVLAEDLED